MASDSPLREFDPFAGVYPPARDDVYAASETGICIKMNPQTFMGYLVGLCERLTSADAWSGTEAARLHMANEFHELQLILGEYQTCQEALAELEEGFGIVQVGQLMPSVGNIAASAGWLECDGSTYNKVDYPELWAIIDAAVTAGAQWTHDANTFDVPDINTDDRAVIGGSISEAGSSGGAKTHVLTESEMPSHRHGLKRDTGSSSNVNWIPYGAFTGAGVSSPNAMEHTGGGAAHNNMPPFLQVKWYILAKPIASIVGQKGDKGDKGDAGGQGLQGAPGATGLNGQPGIQGIQGIPGVCDCVGETDAPPFDNPQTDQNDCGLALGLGDWLVDKFSDCLIDIQNGIAAARTISNIVSNLIGAIPIFGDAIETVLEFAEDVAAKDIEHLLGFTQDVAWTDKVDKRLYCIIRGLPHPVSTSNCATVVNELAAIFAKDLPEGPFVTLIGQAFALYLKGLSSREIARRATIYINDVSNDCSIFDCGAIQQCVWWPFASSAYEFVGEGATWYAGIGWQDTDPVDNYTQFDCLISWLEPIEVTSIYAKYQTGAVSPSQRLQVTLLTLDGQSHDVIVDEDPGYQQVREYTWDGSISDVVGMFALYQGFLGAEYTPTIQELKMTYYGNKTFESAECE